MRAPQSSPRPAGKAGSDWHTECQRGSALIPTLAVGDNIPPLQKKKPDLEKYTKQQSCSIWQGHCMNLGTEMQLLQKSQVSLFCVAGIWHGRQARVCPPRSTHHVKGFGGVSSRRETAASEHSFRAHPQIFLVTNSQLTP